ncbi:MAG: hypothetical protein K2N54_00445 [Helicobacter sp.]|nr:hypothetical protein [Helicobacter sp.]
MSNGKEMFRYAQHDKWRCGFNRTYYNFMSATKVAPPKKHAESQKFPSVIASERCERGNQQAKNPKRAFKDVWLQRVSSQ